MRILAIGLGGAGCRIADALYANDKKSSKVTCVQALAVDVDNDTLTGLRALPEQAKVGFMPLESDLPSEDGGSSQHPKVDLAEIIARIQNINSEEIDALMVCCGLGGSMTDVAPNLITALRATTAEPIFGLITLPALSEGEKRSAKAADDIENIAPLLDGALLFDNETWLKKIASRRDAIVAEMKNDTGFFGLGKSAPKLTPQEVTERLLNQNIIRRISLILRAGEFRADGGIDLAEVVMDSSEVLNTISGMGFVAIGYSVESLQHGPLAFLSRLRSPDTSEEQRKSAERIIELAKKAIYEEVSIPCDMTSAAKALILVAGPSHEISMKGFMTVRKWIDRSIAGMETRSGDYPVTNSKSVAIIVVLSGLRNIPRVTELMEIRAQYRGVPYERPFVLSSNADQELQYLNQPSAIAAGGQDPGLVDEMLVLPQEKAPKKKPIYERVDTTSLNQERPVQSYQVPSQGLPAKPMIRTAATIQWHAPPATKRDEEPAYVQPPVKETVLVSPRKKEPSPSRKSLESSYESITPIRSGPVKNRDLTQQKIERDLQKQRMSFPSENPADGKNRPLHEEETAPRPYDGKTTLVRRVSIKKPMSGAIVSEEPVPPKTTPPAERKIIRIRKKETPAGEFEQYRDDLGESGPSRQEELELTLDTDEFQKETPTEEIRLDIKHRTQKPRDDMFLGKAVSQKEPLRVKDEALLHTEIKTKKARTPQDDERARDIPVKIPGPVKKTGVKPSAKDEERS